MFPPRGKGDQIPVKGEGGCSAFCRGGKRLSPVSAIFFAVVAIAVFLTPPAVRAARIAGEDQPVPTVPSPSTVQPSPKPPDRRETPARTEAVKPAAGQSAAPAESAPAPGLRRRAPKAPPGGVTAPAVQSTPAAPQKTAASAPSPSKAAASEPGGRYVTIDFDSVDIQVFIKFVSEMTGRNFVIDDKVKGKVTVVSPNKISVDEVYKVFESVLEIYGFTTVDAGDVTKVILAQEARGKNVDLRVKPDTVAPEDKIVTQILSLQHASSDEMKKVLDPLISKNSIILSYAPTGMLIITDVLSNIKRLQGIVTALDVEGVGEVISYIPLQAALATEIVKSLIAVFPPQRPGSAAIRIVADERTNSVILLASETHTTNVKKLINLMDKDIPRSGTSLHVYRLQNGSAEDLTKVLMNLPRETKDPKAPAAVVPAAAAAAGKAVALSKDVNVVADKATNTLIITASRDDYKTLEGIIRQLDEPRPMVYIEALIMEVSVNKNFNIGVEWRGLKDIGNSNLSGLGPSATGLGMAGFSGSAIIPQVNATTGAVTMPAGFSLGVVGAGIQIGNILFPNIGAVLQAYQKDSDVSILSTPQLLTLNNEDAEINVGKNVPYLSRSDVSSVTSTTTAVYGQSYEYKDVGIVLKITPNINEDRFVRLKIDQQVTKLTGEQTSTPTTLKRTAKTTVVIKDNETVVIGGLIDDSTSIDTQQVPCLGDIPLIGWLFKTRGSGREKSNLFVFITPHIIRNQAEAAAIYKQKLDDIGNIEEGIIRMNEKKTFQKPQTDGKE